MTKSPTPKQIKSNAIHLLFGLPIVGLIWMAIIRVINESQEFNWYIFVAFAFVGLSIGTLALLLPLFGKITFLIWHRLIYIIDQLVIWTTLPLFYYLIFCLYSLLIRLFGKSKLKDRTKPASSFWENIEQPKSNRRYIQQF